MFNSIELGGKSDGAVLSLTEDIELDVLTILLNDEVLFQQAALGLVPTIEGFTREEVQGAVQIIATTD